MWVERGPKKCACMAAELCSSGCPAEAVTVLFTITSVIEAAAAGAAISVKR